MASNMVIVHRLRPSAVLQTLRQMLDAIFVHKFKRDFCGEVF